MHTDDLDDRDRWNRLLVDSKNMVKDVTEEEVKELNELTEASVSGAHSEIPKNPTICSLIRRLLLARPPRPAASTISLSESYTTTDPEQEINGTLTSWLCRVELIPSFSTEIKEAFALMDTS